MSTPDGTLPGGLGKFQVTDREECGLLIKNDDEMIYIVLVPNRADSDDDYQIIRHDYEAVENVLSPDEKIVGFMHTHLEHHECEPSDTDLDGAELHPEMMHLIYKPSTGEVCWYVAADGGTD